MNSYIVKHKNEVTRAASRSGGIFTALSDQVLENSGVVYGCVLNDNFDVVHVRAVSQSDRNAMRGSKYVQSKMGDCFQSVQRDLQAGTTVLFSGTSCQVDGLKSYCKARGLDCSKLFTVDILCHGVPSPLVWKDYMSFVTEKHHGKIENVNFRNKQKYGWTAHYDTVTVDGVEYDNNIFTKLFYEHNILRECCFHCPYKSTVHPGDITIADAWGVNSADPEFDDNKGVSLVLLNTQKGQTLFNTAAAECECKVVDIKSYMQPPLIAPFPKPAEYEKFWSEYKKNDFEYIAKKYGMDSNWMKAKRKAKNVIRKVLKR